MRKVNVRLICEDVASTDPGPPGYQTAFLCCFVVLLFCFLEALSSQNGGPHEGGAFDFLFTTEHRGALAKSLGEGADQKSICATLSDRWKALDPEQKKQYEERARQAMAEYAEKMDAFREAGGVVAPKAARGSKARRRRGGGPAPHPGGQERDSTAALQEASDEDFLVGASWGSEVAQHWFLASGGRFRATGPPGIDPG